MGEREKVLKIVKDILVGPNPLPGFTQDNGEEILFCDSPLKTYVTGVLFPQVKISECELEDKEEENVEEIESDIPFETVAPASKMIGDKNIAEPSIEAETSKINNFRQSAMGITLCIPDTVDFADVKISVGSYTEGMSTVPMEKKDNNGNRIIVRSEKERKCYYRKQNNAVLRLNSDNLPNKTKRHKEYQLFDAEGKEIKGLGITVTFRLRKPQEGFTIYTITLINTNPGSEKNIDATDCWYQCSFDVECNAKLLPLPANFCAEIKDDDYQLNALLYRDVKTYAIGHGCAATWNDTDVPTIITASVMPEYEVKPIVPTTSNAKLSMKMYALDKDATFSDLQVL